MFRLAAIAVGLLPLVLFEAVCVWADWGRPALHDDPFVGFAGARPEIEARAEYLKQKAAEAIELLPQAPPELGAALQGVESPSQLADLIAGLEGLRARGVQFALSYDGMTGGKTYGAPLPEALGLTRLLLDAGTSAQATLSGRSARTVESLYLSPGLRPPSGAGQAVDASFLKGLGFAVLASLSYAAVTLLAQRQRQATGFALAFWQCALGGAMLAWWPMLHGLPQGAGTWGWLAGIGMVHSALAYVLLYEGMRRLESGQVAVLQFVYPAAAILIDVIAYQRALGATAWLGLSMMAGALLALRSRRV